MKTVTIYALPKTGPIRYIGMSGNPKRRLQGHLRSQAKTHLGCWIRSLSESPGFRVLKVVPESEWQEWEMRYIRCAKALGFDLVNATDGGEGMLNPSPEARKNLSESHKGQTAWNKGKKGGPAWNKGKKMGTPSLEHREKISRALTGVKKTAEHVARVAAANAGKSHPPEWGAAISAAKKGIKTGPYKKRTPEHCAKLKAAWARWRAAKESQT